MPITSISSLYSVASTPSATASPGPMTVQKALQAMAKAPGTRVDVADTAQNIAKNWDRLKAAANSIASVSLSDMSQRVNISADQYMNGSALRDLFTSGESFEVYGTVQKLSSLASDQDIQALNVLDTNVNIQNSMAAMAAYGDKLKSIQFSNTNNVIKMTQSDYLETYAPLLQKMPANAALQITGVSVDNFAQLLNNRRVKSVEIRDTIDNVQQNLNRLNGYASKISGIQNTSDTDDLFLTAKQFSTNTAILNKIVKGYDLQLMATSIRSANDLKNNRLVEGIQVIDTGANVTKNIRLLKDGFGGKLNSISLTDPDTSLRLSYNDVVYNKSALEKISSNYKVELTNRYISADQFLGLNDLQLYHFSNVQIADSAANINSKLGDSQQDAWVFDGVKSITTTDAGAVLAGLDNTEYISKFAPGTRFDFGELSMGDFLYASKIAKIVPTSVTATAAEVEQNFSELAKYNSSIQKITLAQAQPIALPRATIGQNTDLISKIKNPDLSPATVDYSRVSIADFLGNAPLRQLGGAVLYGTAAQLQSNFSALANYKDQIASINVYRGYNSDSVLAVNQSAVQNNSELIKKITGDVIFTTSDAPALIADGGFVSTAIQDFQSSVWNRLDDGSSASIDPNYGTSSLILNSHNSIYYGGISGGQRGADSTVYQNIELAPGKYLLSFNARGDGYGGYNDSLSFGAIASDINEWSASVLFHAIDQANPDIAAGIKAANAQTVVLDSEIRRINFEFDVSAAESAQDLKLFFRKNSGERVTIDSVSLLKIG